jgi:hypothetical protein
MLRFFFKGYVMDRRIGFIEEEAKRPKYSVVDTDVENATPRYLLGQQKTHKQLLVNPPPIHGS